MLKKVLCMAAVMVMALATLTVANAGAAGEAFNMGDVNCDGKHTIKDATILQKKIAGFSEFEDIELYLSDVDENGRVNVRDVTMIQKYLAGAIESDVFGRILESGNTETEQDKYIDETVATDPATEAYEQETTPEAEATEAVTEPEAPKTPVTAKPSEIEYSPDGLNITEIEDKVAERFLELVNEERAKVGAGPLKTNNILTKAAKIRGEEIVISFSHDRPDGTQCYTAIEDQSGFLRMGENIAYNAGLIHFASYVDNDKEIEFAAQFFFGQFKGSPGHYANMIREDFDLTGIGVNFVVHDGYTECNIAHMFAQQW